MLLNVPAAAKELGLGVSTLRALIRRGALPTVRLGRRVLIRPAVVEELIATHEVQFAGPRTQRTRDWAGSPRRIEGKAQWRFPRKLQTKEKKQ